MSGVEGVDSTINSESSATIRLDPRIYTREALLRAAYWHSAAAYIRMPESPDDSISVEITLKKQPLSLDNPKPISLNHFIAEFCNSLLDFELRRQVESETAPIRQLVLAKAFSESGVLEDDPSGKIEDPVEMRQPNRLVQILNSSPPQGK